MNFDSPFVETMGFSNDDRTEPDGLVGTERPSLFTHNVERVCRGSNAGHFDSMSVLASRYATRLAVLLMVEALRAAGVPARVVGMGTVSWNQEAVELNDKAV